MTEGTYIGMLAKAADGGLRRDSEAGYLGEIVREIVCDAVTKRVQIRIFAYVRKGEHCYGAEGGGIVFVRDSLIRSNENDAEHQS